MDKVEIRKKILIAVAGLVFLSAISMITVISIFSQDMVKSASTAILVMMLLHILILFGFLHSIGASKRGSQVNNGLNILLAIVLLLFGLVYMDGAFAFLDHLFYVSILMFISIFCDFVAALITFASLLLLRPKNKIK